MGHTNCQALRQKKVALGEASRPNYELKLIELQFRKQQFASKYQNLNFELLPLYFLPPFREVWHILPSRDQEQPTKLTCRPRAELSTFDATQILFSDHCCGYWNCLARFLPLPTSWKPVRISLVKIGGRFGIT